MSSPTVVGAQLGTSANAQTYANTNLYVLQFTYTAGVVSSVSVYSNPTAGQSTVPAPDFTVSSGLPSFGALVNFGLYDGSAIGELPSMNSGWAPRSGMSSACRWSR